MDTDFNIFWTSFITGNDKSYDIWLNEIKLSRFCWIFCISISVGGFEKGVFEFL
jgi:hypothetical protein